MFFTRSHMRRTFNLVGPFMFVSYPIVTLDLIVTTMICKTAETLDTVVAFGVSWVVLLISPLRSRIKRLWNFNLFQRVYLS